MRQFYNLFYYMQRVDNDFHNDFINRLRSYDFERLDSYDFFELILLYERKNIAHAIFNDIYLILGEMK